MPTDPTPTPTPREVVARAIHRQWRRDVGIVDAALWEELFPDEREGLLRQADAGLAALAATGDAPLGAWDAGNIGRWFAEECPCGECKESGNVADMCPKRSVRNLLDAYTALAWQLAAARAELFEAQQAGELLNDARREIAALRAERDALRARVAALEGMVGAVTGREHERGCPGLQAWDVPGACSCEYPEVTRCRGCGARLRRGTPDWRDDAAPARPTPTKEDQ